MRGFRLLYRLQWPLFPCRRREFPISACCPHSTKASGKGKAAPLQERRMIDKIKIYAKGGDGGNGCWSIRRSRTDWNGKPDGGNGGKGGDVILECSPVVWDYSNLQHHLNAKRGGHGQSKKLIGSRGSDKVVQVPIGTVIHLIRGKVIPCLENVTSRSLEPWKIHDIGEEHLMIASECINIRECPEPPLSKDEQSLKICSTFCSLHKEHSDNRLSSSKEYSINVSDVQDEFKVDHIAEDIVQYNVAELTEPNQRVIVACGGAGGLGNAYMGKALNPHNKVRYCEDSDFGSTDDEQFDASQSLLTGLPGTESILILELKSIADVGLVGMPNAGKSTLLGAISRAKPAIGDYAFTTLRPNIGKLNYKDFFSVSVADIPGIIKGAHQNRGLGHAFLRHIERTKVLAYVVDLASTLHSRNGIPPWEQLIDLLLELEHHQSGLSNRPSLIVANKIDENGAEEILEELKQRVRSVPIFPICAVLEEGIPELKSGLRRLVDGIEFHVLTLDSIAC